jgi:hypothetical protein
MKEECKYCHEKKSDNLKIVKGFHLSLCEICINKFKSALDNDLNEVPGKWNSTEKVVYDKRVLILIIFWALIIFFVGYFIGLFWMNFYE